jgi:hypothetical protein
MAKLDGFCDEGKTKHSKPSSGRLEFGGLPTTRSFLHLRIDLQMSIAEAMAIQRRSSTCSSTPMRVRRYSPCATSVRLEVPHLDPPEFDSKGNYDRTECIRPAGAPYISRDIPTCDTFDLNMRGSISVTS